MRTLVLDPGFEDLSSHHTNVNKQLISHFRANSCELNILSSINLQGFDKQALLADNTIPWFISPCYVNGLRAVDHEQEQRLALQFSIELSMALKERHINRADNLIIHSCFSFHILGLALFLQKEATTYAGKVIVCSMFHPGHRVAKQPHELDGAVWYRRYKLALAFLSQLVSVSDKSAAPRRNVRLATSCKTYQEAFSDCSSLPWEVHPAINFTDPIKPKAVDSEPYAKRVILYIGALKHDKGIVFLVDALPQILSRFSDTEFFVQFNEQSPNAHVFDDLKKRLVDIKQQHNNLSLTFAPLSQKDYEHQFATSDALVMLYDVETYQLKTSGLLWDAIRHPHLNVFLPQGIWASEEYQALGGQPFLFNEGCSDSLCEQLALWKAKPKGRLSLSEYGRVINQSFSKWCLQSLGFVENS
ncbi:hypothetical protein PN836_016695 [Ningiella sp. W23]|uniref:hypothetical protein n=1 Tax=Ningiella sp. W23 TaxID=3023715 RepID=UPI00375733A1